MESPARERAQSSPIGYILIISLTLTAAVAIVVLGAVAIEDTQEDSQVSQAEQALTQFDSRAAQVALDESQSQTVSLGGSGGDYHVDEDAGRVVLKHENWNGSSYDYAGNGYENPHEVYNETLGSVVYRSDGTELAYQGGGVWRKDSEGASRMVSPPEFHYRRATLTFPLVRIQGSGSASGNVDARITEVDTASDIFPSEDTYPDGEEYLNPVDEGNMSVEVTSEYCEGWRTYFLERTEGEVSDCNDGTVEAQLITLGTQGEFDITDGEELQVRGMDNGHALQEFQLVLRTDRDDQNSDFNNIRWRLYGEDDQGRQLEFFIAVGGIGQLDCSDPEPARVVVYYSPDSGDNYHSWVNDDTRGAGTFDVECENSESEEVLRVDFTGSSNTFEYHDFDDLSKNKDLHYRNDADSFNSTVSFGEHQGEDGENDSTYEYPTDSADEDSPLVARHYFALVDDIDMQVSEDAAAGLSDDSTGNIVYEGSGEVVTFLHVTENRVEVRLLA